MRLLKTTIEGYRSIRDAVDLHVDPHVTVVLGANDHGKTNLLDALCHLNPEVGFDEERDLNWDRQDAKDSLPAATYELEFSDPELRELREAERFAREEGVLREFLDVFQAELEAAEEAAGPLRTNAEAAAKALAESEGATNETEGASDEAAEDSAAAEAGEEARSRIAALQGELDSANVEAASAQAVVDAAARKVALAEARLIEVRAARRGESRTPRVNGVARQNAKTPFDRRRCSNQARLPKVLVRHKPRHYSEIMPRPEIPMGTIDRFVELVALGLSTHEAARAVRMSERSGDRYLARADIKLRIEEQRRKSPARLLEDVRDTVEDLLAATDKEGSPDWNARARGVELMMKHQDRFGEVDLAAARDILPAGAWVVFPSAWED